MRAIAVTTIADQSAPGIHKLFKLAEICSAELVIIGDKKTSEWDIQKLPSFVHYFSVEDQIKKWPTLANLLPYNHYARKNLAYLWAIENRTSILLDTDDDNCSPLNVFESNLSNFRSIENGSEWVNIYGYFGKNEIWPRGIPLDEARKTLPPASEVSIKSDWHCFQAIVDGDPDLDAIGRMLYPGAHYFEDSEPVLLPNSSFCPTNSQATLWKQQILPFLYLPVTSTFRMTDIWRGILVSGYLRKQKLSTAFGKLGFLQERNEHNLVNDFLDEVSGHQFSRKVKAISDNIWMKHDRDFESTSERYLSIYSALVAQGLLSELDLVCVREFMKIANAHTS
jgi:hypothetical protein